MKQDMKTILTRLFTELPLGKLPLGNMLCLCGIKSVNERI